MADQVTGPALTRMPRKDVERRISFSAVDSTATALKGRNTMKSWPISSVIVIAFALARAPPSVAAVADTQFNGLPTGTTTLGLPAIPMTSLLMAAPISG